MGEIRVGVRVRVRISVGGRGQGPTESSLASGRSSREMWSFLRRNLQSST
jgi:hypothetical protein